MIAILTRASARAGLARALAGLALAAACVPSLPARTSAQEAETLPGVRLGLAYENAYVPALAIQPFTGRFGGQAAASAVEAIVGRDLINSDRFQVIDSLPEQMVGETVDYALWDRLGAVWLLSGQLEGSGDGFVLVLRLHDVVYRQVKQEGRFQVPDPSREEFRMAVHRASDDVVEWVFDEPGMAASRIAFAMTRDGGATKELYVVDSDGENLRRVTNHRSLSLSPSWSPGGRHIVYNSYHGSDGLGRIYEVDLETGESTGVTPLRDGNYITPAYLADGETVAFSVLSGTRTGLFTYNVRRDCCLTNLTEGRWDDLSPTFSPDGRFIAFNSNRLGVGVPQIYTMPAAGGSPELLSPYQYGSGGYYSAPDWSPFGNLVAFHGRVGRTGRYHILVARMGEGRRLLQLTAEGNNEDPSWAPDGRHLVFRGERDWGKGLFIVDTATGRIRPLLRGVDANTPDWSPSIGG
jgi:TolB protein